VIAVNRKRALHSEYELMEHYVED